MTPPSQLAELQSTLSAALQDAAASADGESGVLVRQHLSAQDEEGATSMMPALFCLGLGRSLGGSEEATLAPAVSLALLAQMARVFCELDTGTGISVAWGMPRALNAGDAFYAMAQKQLLQGCAGLSPEIGVEALQTLDDASRELSEALQAAAAAGANGPAQAARSLYPFAGSLAGLMLGLDDAETDEIVRLSAGLGSHQEVSLEEALRRAAALKSEA
jgi:hypothetical protein